MNTTFNKCVCGFSSQYKSSMYIHYTTTIHQEPFALVCNSERRKKDIIKQHKIKKIKDENEKHKKTEDAIIQKFIDCDDYTMGLILEEIIQYQFGMINKQSKKMPMIVCLNHYNEEMNNIHIIWDTSKNWWVPDANTRYDPDFKNKISKCLKPTHLLNNIEYSGRMILLRFKDIIERNYYLMNLG